MTEIVKSELTIESSLKSLCDRRNYNCQFEKIEQGIYLFGIKAKDESRKSFHIPVTKEIILFAFCPEGKGIISTSLSGEKHVITPERNLMFSNPYQEWDLWIALRKNTELQILVLTIEKLHSFFGLFLESNKVEMSDYLKGFRLNTYYLEKPALSSIKVCIHQLFTAPGMNGLSKTFFRKSKILEFLAFYMNRPSVNGNGASNCPYIIDINQEEKIKQAEKIMIDNMIDPPTIKELAKMVGTNEFRLKSDFRYVFGETIYGHLLRHRMEVARNLLDRKKMQVQEVAEKVGYANTSHFITAFKKQFGITPKKYLQSA